MSDFSIWKGAVFKFQRLPTSLKVYTEQYYFPVWQMIRLNARIEVSHGGINLPNGILEWRKRWCLNSRIEGSVKWVASFFKERRFTSVNRNLISLRISNFKLRLLWTAGSYESFIEGFSELVEFPAVWISKLPTLAHEKCFLSDLFTH